MKKIFLTLVIIFSVLLFTNCDKNDDTPAIIEIDYVGFESDFQIGVDPTGTATGEVKVAVSQASNSDRTFNLAVVDEMTTADPSAYSFPASVTIPANSTVGAFNVEVVGENLNPAGTDMLTIEITSQDSGLFKSDPISLNLKPICPRPEVILDITFDQYPEEIFWRIIDLTLGEVIYASATPAGYGAYAGLSGGVTEAFCIPPGDYRFDIFDAYADGAGPTFLTFGETVIFASADGAYGAGGQFPFTIE